MIQPYTFAHFGVDPFFAMAFDEALLRAAERTPKSAFFRLYSWQPGGITIGFNQRKETAVDWNKVGGTPVVRRVTGGRALYHDPTELTYAVAINRDAFDPADSATLSKTVAQTIAEGIVTFLDRAGITAQYLRTSQTYANVSEERHKVPCFALHARYEIVSEVGKLVASAARVTPKAFFQHGSIKLNGVAMHPALHLPGGTHALPSFSLMSSHETLSVSFFDALSDAFSFSSHQPGKMNGYIMDFLPALLAAIRQDPTGKRPPD